MLRRKQGKEAKVAGKKEVAKDFMPHRASIRRIGTALGCLFVEGTLAGAGFKETKWKATILVAPPQL